MNCEYCKKPTHIWFECKDKPPGWRPARLTTKSTEERRRGDGSVKAPSGVKVGVPQKPTASVDTASGPVRATKVIVPSADGATPSPGAKFSKAAWMKAKMPAYMRQYRADIKSGIRKPTPRVKK